MNLVMQIKGIYRDDGKVAIMTSGYNQKNYIELINIILFERYVLGDNFKRTAKEMLGMFKYLFPGYEFASTMRLPMNYLFSDLTDGRVFCAESDLNMLQIFFLAEGDMITGMEICLWNY